MLNCYLWFYHRPYCCWQYDNADMTFALCERNRSLYRFCMSPLFYYIVITFHHANGWPKDGSSAKPWQRVGPANMLMPVNGNESVHLLHDLSDSISSRFFLPSSCLFFAASSSSLLRWSGYKRPLPPPLKALIRPHLWLLLLLPLTARNSRLLLMALSYFYDERVHNQPVQDSQAHQGSIQQYRANSIDGMRIARR